MFSVVFQSLLPVFLMIALGTALRYYGFLPPAFFAGLNKFAFWVALPCMLFLEIARSQESIKEALPVFNIILAVMVILLGVSWIVAKITRVKYGSVGTFIQGAIRANSAYVGLPVIMYALDKNDSAIGLAALVLAPSTAIFNFMGVVLLLKRTTSDPLQHIWRVLRAICTNPLIIACALGLIANLREVTVPEVLTKTIRGVGGSGLPAALLALGASLSVDRVRGQMKFATLASLLRVAAAPLLGWLLMLTPYFRIVDPDMRIMTFLYLACPTAVASYVMADQMGGDRDLAGAIVVLSTVLAFPSMAILLYLCHM